MKSVVPIEDVDLEELGPEMLALTPKQRRFVMGYVRGGATDASACARAAGYSDSSGSDRVTAHRLLHSPNIIAAIKAESGRHLNGAAYIAAAGLVEIAADPEHRDRYKAIDSILDRVGMPRMTQHNVEVEHYDTRSTAELLRLLREYGAGRALPLIEGSADKFSALSGSKHQVEGD